LDSNILNAYCFLCNNYNFGSWQDEIILAGFSRGAFTVRCLAHFINTVGLLRRKGLVFLPTLFQLWRENKQGELKELAENLNNFRAHPVKIKVLAEWDTVSATADFSFVNEEVPANVENAFLAMALHEKRATFKPMLWKKAGLGTKVEQCAFAGCHSDIGGGNRDPGLSTIPLLWMVSKIREASDAAFDHGTILQFITPFPLSFRNYSPGLDKRPWPFTKRKTPLYDLTLVKGMSKAFHNPAYAIGLNLL